MKLSLVFLVLIVCLFGCQKQEVQKEAPTELESSTDDRPLYISNAKPRNLSISLSSTGFFAAIPTYCWAQQLEECPEMLKINPEDKLVDMKVFSKPPNSQVTFGLNLTEGQSQPMPDKYELFLYEEGNYTPVDIGNDTFNLPAEEGTYVYVLKATYDADVKGVTFYTFKIQVKV